MNGKIRTLVRGAYDIQKLRIQMGNRIVGNFKVKLGQEPGESEKELDAQGKLILNNLRVSYKKITDGVKTFPRKGTFKSDGVITDYTELCLVAQYVELETTENQHFRRLEKVLDDVPIFSEYLKGVKGIGPAMAGVIISEIDISKSKYASSIWKYAGLDVAPDGLGRSRKKQHLVEIEYENKDGEMAVKSGITFNPWLKTKLIGVLASSFLRAGDNPYSKLYNNYKTRLENHIAHKEKTKGHRHNMAMRYMVKIFLIDLYVAWRKLEGLEVHPPYSEAKLGMRHRVG